MTSQWESADRAASVSLVLDRGVRHLALNALWLALSLTIAGLPAATVALHAVVKEWSEGDERPVVGRFLASLRAYAARGTILCVAAASLLALVGVNLWLTSLMGTQRTGAAIAVIAVGIPLLLVTVMIPSAVVDASDLRSTVALAFRRSVMSPAACVLALVLLVAVLISALWQPFLLFLTPSLAVRVHRGLLGRIDPFAP